MTHAPELLPCPFCGGRDIRWRWHETYSIDSSYGTFGCQTCGAAFGSDDTSVQPEDIKSWNTRAPEVQELIRAAVEAERERCAQLADHGHWAHITSKGRDPAKYVSAFSLIAEDIRGPKP